MTHRSDPAKNRELKCEKCGSYESLELHHTKYEPEERVYLEDLRILCSRCHRNDNTVASETKTIFKDGKRIFEMPEFSFEY